MLISKIKCFISKIKFIDSLFATVFILGFIARLYFLIKYGNNLTLQSDDYGYISSAENLLKTGVLTYGYKTPTAFIMPAYPIYLSIMFKLFGITYGQIAARFFQILICLAGYCVIYLMCRVLSISRPFTLIIVGLLVFYPPNIIMPNLLLTETWYTTLMILCTYLCILFLKKPSLKLAIYLGLAFSLAVYFRPVIAPIPVIICICFLARHYALSYRKKFKYAFTWAAIMILFLSPWWIRNYFVFKSFIPFTASSGNPLLYGSYVNYEGIKNGTRPDWPMGKNEFENDRLQKELALQRIKEGFNTGFYNYLRWYTIGKAKYMWRYPFDWFSPEEFNYGFNVKFHYLIIVSGIFGIILIVFRKLHMEYFVILMFIAYNTALYTLYVTSARYCYPQMQLIMIFSGIFFQEAYNIYRFLRYHLLLLYKKNQPRIKRV